MKSKSLVVNTETPMSY